MLNPILINTQLYVQAPEARPLPDDRSSPGLQPPPPQPQMPQQRDQSVQTESLHINLSSHSIRQSTEKELKQQENSSQSKGSTSSNMSSGVEIPYPIDWIFPRLRNPSKLWFITSQLVITLVGLISKFVLGKQNTHTHTRDIGLRQPAVN